MASLTAWHSEVKRILTAAFDPTLRYPVGTSDPTASRAVQFGPADDLPANGGKVAQCVVLWPTAGTEQARFNDVVHQRNDSVLAVFVGPTVLDCLAAVGKGRKALQGSRLTASGPGGGRVREGGFSGAQPVPEPGTDPVRVSLSIQFDAITKEPR